MKKFFIIFGLVLGISSLAYATMFCCPPDKTKEECCAERGKVYCENENVCRTRCRDVTPPECIGGCINPDGECCLWCPTAEVCTRIGKCQKIVDGCYQCVECPDPNPCPAPKCMNEEEVCCASCPRVCPEGECLVNVDGCYECGSCGDDDDDDVDDDPPPPPPSDDDEPTDSEEQVDDDVDDDDDDVDDDDVDDDDDDDVDDNDDDDDVDDDDDDPCDGVVCTNCKTCDPKTGQCTVGGCTSGQECCGGKCITKCTGCNVCVPDSQSCSTDNRCSGDKPTCCNGQCICGACCDKMVTGSAVDCNSAAVAYNQRQIGVDACSHACTNENIYNGLDSFGNSCSYSAPLCSTLSGSDEEVCKKTYYTKDGQCRLGVYVPKLDACCNPIEGEYCCTATGGSICMTEAECKDKFGPITECGDWCCKNGQECADESTSSCCPVETPKKCGSECCAICNSGGTGCCDGTVCGASCCDENGCNEDETGCAVCEMGEKVCWEGENTWCCSESTECGKTIGECECSGMMVGQTCCHHDRECSICNAYEKEAISDLAKDASINGTGKYRYEGCLFTMMDYGEQEWACLCGGSYEVCYDDSGDCSWESSNPYYPKLN